MRCEGRGVACAGRGELHSTCDPGPQACAADLQRLLTLSDASLANPIANHLKVRDEEGGWVEECAFCCRDGTRQTTGGLADAKHRSPRPAVFRKQPQTLPTSCRSKLARDFKQSTLSRQSSLQNRYPLRCWYSPATPRVQRKHSIGLQMPSRSSRLTTEPSSRVTSRAVPYNTTMTYSPLRW